MPQFHRKLVKGWKSVEIAIQEKKNPANSDPIGQKIKNNDFWN